jgi:hypothetical protein
MAHLISLETALLDPRTEPVNPINPIPGHSLLVWLRTALAPRVAFTEPRTEDWGWYSYATFEGYEYLTGASAIGEPDYPLPLEWILQIHKQRSLKDKLLGRRRMVADDPFAALVEATLKGEPQFSKVERRIE